MNLLHRINRWIFRPRHCLDLGPEAYAGKFKGQQIMLMWRDGYWHFYINQAEVGKDLTPRGAELRAINDIETYFVRGQAA